MSKRGAKWKEIRDNRPESGIEAQAWDAIMAYEEVRVMDGRRRVASGSWEMVGRLGWIKAIEQAVCRKDATEGYNLLVKYGFPKAAFEWIILEHKEKFSLEAYIASKKRLGMKIGPQY